MAATHAHVQMTTTTIVAPPSSELNQYPSCDPKELMSPVGRQLYREWVSLLLSELEGVFCARSQ